MGANLSTNNLKIVLAIGNLVPLNLGYFSSDSDVWSVSEMETGGALKTPDGKMVYWGKNALINVTLTLSGASDSAELLRNALILQQKIAGKDGIVNSISAYLTLNGKTESYLEGVLLSGAGGISYGNEKIADTSWNFAFSERVYV